jgi:legume-like lectin family protein
MRLSRMAAVCGLLTMLTLRPAQAGILFSFSGFPSVAGLTLVGNATTAVTGDGPVLRLTPAVAGQSGAAYSTTAVPLGPGNTFSTQFQFRIANPGGFTTADGFTFLLSTSTTGLGSGGAGLGYQGAAGQSFAIEFDTYNNARTGSLVENSSNHVAVDLNGILTNTAITNVYGVPSCGFPSYFGESPYTAPGCLANGNLWTVVIGYDGSSLTVTLTDPAEGTTFTALNNYPINLAAALGQNTAFVGFTAGTGAGFETHDIVNWSFANTTQLGPAAPSSVPALSPWALGAAAALFAAIALLTLRRAAA